MPRSIQEIHQLARDALRNGDDDTCMCGGPADHGCWEAGHAPVPALSYVLGGLAEELMTHTGQTFGEAITTLRNLKT